MTGEGISANDVKTLLIRVYNNYKKGKINETQAQKEAYILNSVLKAIELTEHEERLTKIEELLGDNSLN